MCIDDGVQFDGDINGDDDNNNNNPPVPDLEPNAIRVREQLINRF